MHILQTKKEYKSFCHQNFLAVILLTLLMSVSKDKVLNSDYTENVKIVPSFMINFSLHSDI